MEHIRPKKHGGDDSLENLALACDRCNCSKGSNLSGFDPETGTIVVLFNPRTDRWGDHVAVHGARIAGITSIGRVTVALLNMNEERRVQWREELFRLGEEE